MIDSKCVGLTQKVLSQVSEISAIYHTTFHPLHIVFKHLSQLENHDLVEVILGASHALSDQFQDALGEFHLSALSRKVDRLRPSAKYSRSTDLDTVVDNIRNLLTRGEVQCGTGSTRFHVLLKSLGDILMISGRYDEVERPDIN